MVADLFGRGGENTHAGERRAASRDNHTHRTNLHYDTPPPQPLYGGWRNTLRSKQAWLEDTPYTVHLTPYIPPKHLVVLPHPYTGVLRQSMAPTRLEIPLGSGWRVVCLWPAGHRYIRDILLIRLRAGPR